MVPVKLEAHVAGTPLCEESSTSRSGPEMPILSPFAACCK